MFDPKKQAELDQHISTILDFFPPIWAGLYKKLIDQQMPPFVALEMVKAYIMRPNDQQASEPEEEGE